MPLHQPGRGIGWQRGVGQRCAGQDGFTCRQRQRTLSGVERAHQTPAVTPEYQRIVGRGQPVDVAVEFISFPT